jgi:putative Mg2+ transporter-C (MgtC) family protein
MHDLFPILDRTLTASNASTVAAVGQRLTVAALLGAAIGVERQLKHRPAGLRTIMFISFGAALFTIVSALMAGGVADPTRIAAQIVTGIGFIGAGVILHSGASVQGVTTAATIFIVAAIGMCAGTGLMIPAAMATVLVIFGLLILGILEDHVFPRRRTVAYQTIVPDSGYFHKLLEGAQKERETRLTALKITDQGQSLQVEFTLEARPRTQQELQDKLRQELDSRKIVSFSLIEQE